MGRPNVELSNYEAVYDYYETHRQNMAFARFAHFVLARVYRCDLTTDDGAPEAITDAIESGTRLIISPNHITADDQYVIVSFAEKLKALRPLRGRTFIPAEPSLFRRRGRKGKMLRWAVDELGALPTFRLADLERRKIEITDAVEADYRAATLRASEIQVNKLNAGEMMAGFWEGTRNRADHRIVQPLKKGMAYTAIAAATTAAVAVLPVGLYYGSEPEDYAKPVLEGKHRPHVHVGTPLPVDTDDPVALAARVHTEIQRCVDVVVARAGRIVADHD
ncbi:MAG: 1-acyl-sn-glycerol-3-phosphate acyltransferase [Actinobacteria bacterium]|nr:1-acyl-sn-glycerol-3-phosphate acyltransferase [Actinomycetota bacterium]